MVFDSSNKSGPLGVAQCYEGKRLWAMYGIKYTCILNSYGLSIQWEESGWWVAWHWLLHPLILGISETNCFKENYGKYGWYDAFMDEIQMWRVFDNSHGLRDEWLVYGS